MKNLIILGNDTAPVEIQKIHGHNITEKEFCHIASIFDTYAEKGAIAIKNLLSPPYEGSPLIHNYNWPSKGKGNLLEFAFSAHSFYKSQEIRGFVEITYLTPQEKMTDDNNIEQALYHLLERMQVEIVTDFCIAKIDPVEKSIIDIKGRKINFDMLVTLPETNKNIKSIKEFETQFDHQYCSVSPNRSKEIENGLSYENTKGEKPGISKTSKRINHKHKPVNRLYTLDSSFTF